MTAKTGSSFGRYDGRNSIFQPKEAISAESSLSAVLTVSAERKMFLSVSAEREKYPFGRSLSRTRFNTQIWRHSLSGLQESALKDERGFRFGSTLLRWGDGGSGTGRSGRQYQQMVAHFETNICPLRHSMVWYPELGIHQWLPTFVCMCVLVKGRGQQGGYTPELRPSSLLGRLVALIQICP